MFEGRQNKQEETQSHSLQNKNYIIESSSEWKSKKLCARRRDKIKPQENNEMKWR